MPIAGLIAAVLAGLLGGAHCAAMCGGFASALAGTARGRPSSVVGWGATRSRVWRELPHNLGRITTYVVLGAIAGGTGGAALAAGDWVVAQRVLYVVANIFLLALAVAIASNGKGIAFVQRLGAALFRRVMPSVRPLASRGDMASRFAVGTIWGLVPCGLVYGVLPIATFAGDAMQGALVMLAFGLGTLPNLLAAGWIVARVRAGSNVRGLRFATAALLGGFAVAGIGRALFGSVATLQGAFCF
jgi:sulfite exporter TauE/SafE